MRGTMNQVLKFRHIYSSAPWGGKMVARHYGRSDVPAVCSESWEISGHRFGMSVVAEGLHAGRTLDELAKTQGRGLIGSKSPVADRFPLLFKLIDARWPLSIQVHPNERTAPLTGGEPKTEAWYVIKAFPGAALYAGLKHPFEEQDLREIVAQGPILLDQLMPLQVSAGDMLYVPGGMPHAIGGGCFIYEVQQASDTTYRFYDWDRADKDGRKRPLHIEESFRSLDYSIPPAKIHRKDAMNTPFFRIRVETLSSPLTLRTDGSSFIAGFVLSGATDVAAFGESFLVPASAGELEICPQAPDTRVILTEL